MLLIDPIRAAVEEFTAAALLGEGFEEALTRFSVVSGARDATLLRTLDTRVTAIIATKDIAEPVAGFMAGKAPVSSRQIRASHSVRVGFRVDHDDYTSEELAVDPFYQDYLLPLGYFWHANVRLAGNSEEHVTLSLKRSAKCEAYDRADVAVLNSVLPDLRAAARIARRVLDAEASGMARLLQHRGQPVFELDSWGRVLRAHLITEPTDGPVQIIRRRLISLNRFAQRGLDTAIAAATTARRPSVAVVDDRLGRVYYLQFFPVPGRARDIFRASVAVAILIEHRARPVTIAFETPIWNEAFGLTDREAELASFIRHGLNLLEIARLMRVQIGTVRNHLKSVFEKTGTKRQSELASLLGRFHP